MSCASIFGILRTFGVDRLGTWIRRLSSARSVLDDIDLGTFVYGTREEAHSDIFE